MRYLVFCLSWLLLTAGCQQRADTGEVIHIDHIVDLTYTLAWKDTCAFLCDDAIRVGEICTVENVANLNKIPVTGATLFVGASKVEKATGGISRIFAVW
jgi:kynurenine formamidase